MMPALAAVPAPPSVPPAPAAVPAPPSVPPAVDDIDIDAAYRLKTDAEVYSGGHVIAIVHAGKLVHVIGLIADPGKLPRLLHIRMREGARGYIDADAASYEAEWPK